MVQGINSLLSAPLSGRRPRGAGAQLRQVARGRPVARWHPAPGRCWPPLGARRQWGQWGGGFLAGQGRWWPGQAGRQGAAGGAAGGGPPPPDSIVTPPPRWLCWWLRWSLSQNHVPPSKAFCLGAAAAEAAPARAGAGGSAEVAQSWQRPRSWHRPRLSRQGPPGTWAVRGSLRPVLTPRRKPQRRLRASGGGGPQSAAWGRALWPPGGEGTPPAASFPPAISAAPDAGTLSDLSVRAMFNKCRIFGLFLHLGKAGLVPLRLPLPHLVLPLTQRGARPPHFASSWSVHHGEQGAGGTRFPSALALQEPPARCSPRAELGTGQDLSPCCAVPCWHVPGSVSLVAQMGSGSSCSRLQRRRWLWRGYT